MAWYVNNNGDWKRVPVGYVNDNGTWRQVEEGYVYENGIWKKFYPEGIGWLYSCQDKEEGDIHKIDSLNLIKEDMYEGYRPGTIPVDYSMRRTNDMVYGEDGYIYACGYVTTNSGSGGRRIIKIDPNTMSIIDEFYDFVEYFDTIVEPTGIDYGDGYVWVAAGSIYKIDATDMSLVDIYDSPSFRFNYDLVYNNGYVFGNVNGGVLIKLDFSLNWIDSYHSYEINHIIYGNDDYLYGSGSVFVKIDPNTMSTISVYDYSSYYTWREPVYGGDGYLYVGVGSEIHKIDPVDMSMVKIHTQDLDESFMYGAYGDDGYIYFATQDIIHKIDTYTMLKVDEYNEHTYRIGKVIYVSRQEDIIRKTVGTNFMVGCDLLWILSDKGTVKVIGDSPSDFSTNYATTIPDLNNVVQISSGGYGRDEDGFFLLSNGKVKGLGRNQFYSMGTTEEYIETPIELPVSNVKQIAGHERAFIALYQDGTVEGMGYSAFLGLTDVYGDAVYYSTPQDLGIGNGVVKVSLCANVAFYLMNDGTVKATGFNSDKEQGIKEDDFDTSPHTLESLTDVIDMWAGRKRVYFLKSDNTLWVQGSQLDGELGIGTIDTIEDTPVQVTALGTSCVQVAIGRDETLFLTNAGAVYFCGSSVYPSKALGLDITNRVDITTPTLTPYTNGVIGIAAGVWSCYIKLENGEIWGGGYSVPYDGYQQSNLHADEFSRLENYE